MSDSEARDVLRQRVAQLTAEPASRIVALVDHQLYCETLGHSGTKYGVETTAMWDDPKRRDVVRIVVEVFEYRPPSDWSQALATEVLLLSV